jgi:hypothetical protein
MVPHEKQMVKRLEKEPFQLIGINSDGGREPLLKIMKEQGITWRQAVDGDTSGPLATKWNVNGWPTIYIVDAKGVIRFRDLRDQQMEDAVVKLIKESKGTQ